MKKLIMCTLLLLFLLVCTSLGSLQVFASSEHTESGGLEVTVTDYKLEDAGDNVYKLTLDVRVVNWEPGTVSLDENLGAVLSYKGRYDFPAEIDFSGKTEIKMLETLNGSLTFTLPALVVLTNGDDISIQIITSDSFTEVECPYDTITAAAKTDLAGVSLNSSENENGVKATVSYSSLSKTPDRKYYYDLTMKIRLTNWETETVPLQGLTEAVLHFENENYSLDYPAVMDFGENQEIRMLETIDGTMTFSLPAIVAMMNKADCFSISLNLQGEKTKVRYPYERVLESILSYLLKMKENFSFENRSTDALELLLGDFYVMDSWEGQKEEGYSWVIQNVEMINWSEQEMMTEEAVNIILSYMDKYNFEPVVMLEKPALDTLEQCKGYFAFQIPEIVAGAETGSLAYHITLQENEWKENFDLADAGVLADAGDVITFGRYKLSSTVDYQEPIKWLVLTREGGKALIICGAALDAKPYNEERKNITWENCTLRKWLNEDFYLEAFTKEEQALIALTQVVNGDNPDYKTEGGNDTEDAVFLLSIAEATEYFDDDVSRIASATQYAKDVGVYDGGHIKVYDEKLDIYVVIRKGAGVIWLRSPGSTGDAAAYVDEDGTIEMDGYGVDSPYGAVRPALWINLDSFQGIQLFGAFD